ncbi:hypothetical protein [Aquiflexum gelatinilyticum]|uniref:hypothetical protein n=1 Tax=Aquiflexum gelatinilyticum TaxID=2961943 RepID=UPI003B848A20
MANWNYENSKLLIFFIKSKVQEASTIAGIYKHNWQIELLFKKLKQNFPLIYFLGDNQNEIEI